MALPSVVRSLGILLAGGLFSAVLCSVVAIFVGGRLGGEGVVWATAGCLLPGLVVVATALSVAPSNRVWVIMSGMLVRMFLVLTLILVLRSLRPELGFSNFHLWVVIQYCWLLLVETWLLLPIPPEQKPKLGSEKHQQS